MSDLHRILSRLQPEPDGEPTLSRRTATLTAINGDGTVQINLSGVDVRARALSGWNMQIGATVQVLVERGDLLVLGEAVGSSGGGFITNITQGVMPFGAADTLVCMAHGIPFTPDPAHFQITARNDPGSTLHWWVDSTDPTDVCIALDQAPGTDLALAWRHIGGPVPYGCADNADIIHDGWAYHVFTASGTFTPTTPGLFDVLVVAGGGGGGNARAYSATPAGADKPPAGGGGAGGVIVQLEWGISGPVPVVVGAGGAAGATPADPPANGDDSTFDTVLVAVGGGAGGDGFVPPGSGGSGGGSARDFGQGGGSTGGAGTPNQGNSGGDGGVGGGTSAGGGGGAGAPGTSGAVDPTNPAGGDGIYIPEFDAPGLGSPQGWFGGGGGGGRYGGAGGGDGGAGGGGSGGVPNANPGADGTGGGGGGATSIAFGVGYQGGDGGDGIVVIRHPVCTPS